MRVTFAILTFSCGVLLGSSTFAATLTPLQGKVWVNQGQGYQQVTGPREAKVGDAVMVSQQGRASVIYADGCSVEVEPVAVHTVGPLSPCASGSLAQQSTNGNSALYAIGTAVVIDGGIAAGALLSQNRGTSPQGASP